MSKDRLGDGPHTRSIIRRHSLLTRTIDAVPAELHRSNTTVTLLCGNLYFAADRRRSRLRAYGRFEWLRWPHRYVGFLVWSLFVIRRDWGLPSPIGNQRMRFEDGRSIRNIKLPKKPARKCGTQTMFSELPGLSELTGRILNQTNHSLAVSATYKWARAQGSLSG
jgi:hypothetical protein